MKAKLFLMGIFMAIFIAPTTVNAMGSRIEPQIESAFDARPVSESTEIFEETQEIAPVELLSFASITHDEILEAPPEVAPVAATVAAQVISNPLSEPVTFITTAGLNLRSTPCTTHARIALVQSGRRVEVTDFLCGEWFEVYYNGLIGFMYAAHLRELPPAGTVAQAGTVELLEWRYARSVMTRGTPATVIDVRTGLTWQIASFSNGNHSDVEPLTPEDTATMLQAFGGTWTWTPRPVVVIINGRTLAASINGMPHAGSTRDNNMNGHICLHFLGSTTHTSAPQHVRDHQAAVMEAYRTASNW